MDKFMKWEAYWLGCYHTKYFFVKEFNAAFLRRFSNYHQQGGKLLEVGPGVSAQVRSIFPNADYYGLDRRKDFCQVLASQLPANHVYQGDIQKATDMPGQFFDTVVLLHVLEHLADLPAALREIRRILIPQGRMLAVIPCEGSLLYKLGRKFSSARVFRREFGEGFEEIMRCEHVNTAREIVEEIQKEFVIEQSIFHPINASIIGVRFNLLAGFHCRAK